jgi:branched-chain amino acid transport system substrate-binding protein
MKKISGALLSLALLTGACTGAGEDTLRVGALYPLSGSQGQGGIDEHRGVLLAAELASADGVGGRSVEIVSIDVAGPEAAPGAVGKLADEGVELVLGSYGSTISAQAARATAARGMLFWETGAVGMLPADARQGELTFRVPPTGGVLGSQAIAFVSEQLAASLDRDAAELRFAITFVDDAYGRSVADGAVRELRERGLNLVGRSGYDYRTLDADALALRVAASKADVLFVSAYLQDAVALRQALVRNHVELLANIGTSSSYCMPEFGAALGIDAVGVFASDKPDAATIDPGGLAPGAAALLERANRAYRERWNEDMSPPALSGFSAAWALFAHVLPAAADTSPASVAAAAQAAELPLGGLPNGSGLRFAGPGEAGAGDNLAAVSVIWEWMAPGRAEIVWPPAFATHPIDPRDITP